VLQGWGGEHLLVSYEAERRPIAEQTIDLATKNMGSLSTQFADALLGEIGPSGDEARADTATRIQIAKDGEFHSLGLVLGYHYGDSPVVVPDGTPEQAHDPLRYLPSARPGARLPHTWLADGRSIYDALGPAMTLLRLDGDADRSVFDAAAATRGIPLDVVDLSAEYLASHYAATLLLVRPDQHIVWRTTEKSLSPSDAADVLDVVTGRIPAS
jgi:hypothetical protein